MAAYFMLRSSKRSNEILTKGEKYKVVRLKCAIKDHPQCLGFTCSLTTNKKPDLCQTVSDGWDGNLVADKDFVFFSRIKETCTGCKPSEMCMDFENHKDCPASSDSTTATTITTTTTTVEPTQTTDVSTTATETLETTASQTTDVSTAATDTFETTVAAMFTSAVTTIAISTVASVSSTTEKKCVTFEGGDNYDLPDNGDENPRKLTKIDKAEKLKECGYHCLRDARCKSVVVYGTDCFIKYVDHLSAPHLMKQVNGTVYLRRTCACPEDPCLTTTTTMG
ncbi:Uncharacterised protein g6645 [Pycnogonum litorale]